MPTTPPAAPAPVSATLPPTQAPAPTAPTASASVAIPAVMPANAACAGDTTYTSDGLCHGTTGVFINGSLSNDLISAPPVCVDGYAWDAPSKTCVKKTPWLMIGLGTFGVVAAGAAVYYARKSR
jgi:hypothetical protein